MNLINLNNINVNFGDRILLNNVSLGINEGDKIGIIGQNGTGKSTLLKIISGDLYDYNGNVTRARNITVSYLSQNPIFDENESILSYVRKGGHQGEIWQNEGECKAILNKLGIIDFNQNTNTLSGGQKKRVALARTLLHKTDVLILDEPTNHLDNEMNEWLEDYLQQFKGVLIMVTHDRYFLDMVTNKIVEIDNSNLYEYQSNYEGFLELKCERENMELATERKRESIFKNELKWVMRGARARSTKQKSRLDRFQEMISIDKIKEKEFVNMDSVSSRMGKKTIEIKNISKRFGENLLIKDFSYIFLKNERIGIVGKNGCGKSTLLNMINGIISPDTGVIEKGDTIKIGYFSQTCDTMDENIRVIDYIKNIAEFLETSNGKISASVILERFLFTPVMQYTLIGKLSGGEKRRLYLLKILMSAPNVLILDEPTNDLDIATLMILEDYLDSFAGIVITVSHDRYFLDRVVNRILAFENDGIITEYMGGFTEYHQKISENIEISQNKNESSSSKISNKDKYRKETEHEKRLKFTYNEQREYDTIEEDIEKIEDRLNELDVNIEKYSSDFVKLNECMKEKEELENKLSEKMERWVYLNDLAERIKENK